MTGEHITKETAQFDYLIGADGAKSKHWKFCARGKTHVCSGFVRKALHIDFEGSTERDLTNFLVDAYVDGFDMSGFTCFGDRAGDVYVVLT